MSGPPNGVLCVRNLVVGYSRADTILQGVSMDASAGEIVAILGPNGAGKSTLLKAICGELSPRSGVVSVAGENVLGLRPRQVASFGVAYVPQEANVFPSMSVRENLEIGAYSDPAGAADRIEGLFARVPILRTKRRDAARTLSGGQRQLLAMAIAMMVEPKLLLLDEPSAGLSPVAAVEMFTTIKEIAAGGVAVVLVEQNALDALDLAGRAYILSAGRNHTSGNANDLAADPEIRRTFLGAGSTTEGTSP
ncbi:MAG: ABC transporter ATP-binding protein [Pseudomonadota bacterium]